MTEHTSLDAEGAVKCLEVDGIPTFLAPPVGGEVHAGLVFRVGQADETLATRGITHLVEHLALHHQRPDERHANGMTDDLFTHFVVHGSAEHVVDYLNGVCRALGDLPLHRIETEKEILRTEEAGRQSGPDTNTAVYRYGLATYGLVSAAEEGLPRLTADMITAWARERFTTQNAALWITAPELPGGLDLRLPPGERFDAPVPTNELPATPAWIGAGAQNLFMHSVVPRSTSAVVFTNLLAKALFHELRIVGGLSYVADASYVPRDGNTAVIRAVADALPEKREAMIGAFVDVLARLRYGVITEDELATAKAVTRRPLEQADVESVSVPSKAMSLLLGKQAPSRATVLAEIDAVTPHDMRETAVLVETSALVQVPALGLDWAGYSPAPQWSDRVVAGRELPPHDDDRGSLIIGDEGVSLWAGANAVTVLFRDVVLMRAYADGGRHLHGRDGFRIHVEPTLHVLNATTLADIDARVPADVVVVCPARPAADVPQPGQSSSSPPPTKAPWGGKPVAVLLWVLLVYAFMSAVSGLSRLFTPPGPTFEALGRSAIEFAITGLFYWALYRRARR